MTAIRCGMAFCWLLALAGCGGGGGGTGGNTDNSWLTFSPASANVETYAGEASTFSVTASSSRTIAEVLNVAIIDSRGVVKPQINVTTLGPLKYVVTMATSETLASGVYEGQFEVRLCRDNPQTCASPYPGSPWQVPYRITVRPATNLTTLSPLAGAGAWSTYQGNAAHTGFVDATVDAAAFNRRWAVPATVGSIVADGGRVVIAPPEYLPGELRALSEGNGTELWRFGTSLLYSSLALGQGAIWFSAYSATQFTTTMYGVEAATGQSRVTSALLSSDQGPRYAGVVADGSVFLPEGSSSTLVRIDPTTGAQQWQTTFGAPYSLYVTRWSPAVAGNSAYMFDYQQLWIGDIATGASLGSIPGPRYMPGISGAWISYGSPVLGAGDLVYVTSYDALAGISYSTGRLTAFDVAARNVRWLAGTSVHSNPVLVNGVAYVVEGSGSLQAYDALSGAATWRWDPPADAAYANFGPDMPLLVVGSYAFVSYGGVTRAIDLRTKQSVWQYPLSGRLAVSPQGILYIGGDQKLVAVNLR